MIHRINILLLLLIIIRRRPRAGTTDRRVLWTLKSSIRGRLKFIPGLGSIPHPFKGVNVPPEGGKVPNLSTPDSHLRFGMSRSA